MIDSANEQHTIKIAKRVKALYNWDRGRNPMSDQYVRRLSDRRHLTATIGAR